MLFLRIQTFPSKSIGSRFIDAEVTETSTVIENGVMTVKNRQK